MGQTSAVGNLCRLRAPLRAGVCAAGSLFKIMLILFVLPYLAWTRIDRKPPEVHIYFVKELPLSAEKEIQLRISKSLKEKWKKKLEQEQQSHDGKRD